MTFKNLFIGIAFCLTSSYCAAQVVAPRIEIVQPSIEHEATSIWRTINDITFFEEQGYKIHLPQESLIDSLINKSKEGTFGNKDFSAIYTLLEARIFNTKNYEKAIHKISLQTGLINKCIQKIDSLRNGWDWEFNSFETYKVRLTLYGTGGSYDPDEGVITLFTDSEGSFMNYENPANTIIHEITHMGMEYSIIKKYNIPHGLKERLVDTFVSILFRDELPKYKVQNMGDIRIDELLHQKSDFDSLNKTIAEFLR
ncbi:hypothetical protein [Flavilitoribacter nigricans]|uniref:Lysine-specific metallo-endopeptidase domain-containing protein n=1 Tax=Flavilitoribacter nigricans (strain ATCC 23147 / DSM 23189 / NBRC 102662 / NCIMB 1420 / SS-2) TaxID=1122177 RepID=A0A2D0N2E8_FLAN2|nr:hypothetical protein [Flavilitoribacter nigricans]PHN02568.1 hypothetical protein CRP01_31835 [Flavilitoribacter nigricans DSM 23189 = NBRC 102662]